MAGDPQLLTDIRLRLRHARLRPVYAVDTDQRAVTTRHGRKRLLDLGRVAGRDNLAQAILLRLLTPRGELAGLGHPAYGSRLHELVGRPNTESTRNLARLHILESLAQEPRIAEILELHVSPSATSRELVEVRLAVQPIGPAEVLDLGPFTLRLEP